MASILPFDELNRLDDEIRQRFGGAQLTDRLGEMEDIIDELLDLFLLAYAMGNSVTNENLASNYEPSVDDVMKVVDAKVAGKTWRERVEDYFGKAAKGEIPVTSAEGTVRRQGESGGASGQSGQTGAKGSDTPSSGVSLSDAITRIAETETHRIANQAAYETAKKVGATEKTWHCMMLPTSRDTHIYLDGVTAPIDGEFYSFKGGSTKYPGQWGIAEEDVNCMCWLSFSK